MRDPFDVTRPRDTADELVASFAWPTRLLVVLVATPALALAVFALFTARAARGEPPFVLEQVAITLTLEAAILATAAGCLARVARAASRARRHAADAVTQALEARRALLVTVVLAVPVLATELAVFAVVVRLTV